MKLIINADDFGLSKSISDGIIEGILGGYITSTSVMANMEYASYAIQEAIKNHIDCIGLHVNLTAGKPIIYNRHLVDEEGVFLHHKNQIENPELTYEDVYNEIVAQIEKVNEFSGGKIKIDHLDTHHFVGMNGNQNIRKALVAIAKEYQVPMRNEFECDIIRPDVLYVDCTLGNVEYETLEKFVAKYQEQDITVELLTHPGYIDDETRKITSYLDRENELENLKKAKEERLFEKVELISFKQL